MSEVNITMNGRSFGIFCEDGQEQRVTDLSHYVDARLKDINQNLVAAQANENDEAAVIRAIDDLAGRIERIAGRIRNA